MTRFFPRFIFLLFLGLAACAPRPTMVFFPQAATIGTQKTIFVATDRAKEADGTFGPHRSEKMAYLSVDVSIPPDHVPGSIEFSRGTPNPQSDFLTTAFTEFPAKSGFQASLGKRLRMLPVKDREAVVYVHGFNNTMADGVYRTAQLVNDFDLPGVAIHYSWPSAANPLGYGYDRDSALIARDGLEELLRAIRASGVRRTLIVAHSMGGLLTMEVLRQMAPDTSLVNGVILISPDIDIEVFESQARRIGKLPQPFVIFVSQKDRALRLSARLTGQKQRLGTLNDLSRLDKLPVTLIDVTDFSDPRGVNHFVTGSSPLLIQLLAKVAEVDAAFRGDPAGRTGILPGTVLTVQNATQIIVRRPVK